MKYIRTLEEITEDDSYIYENIDINSIEDLEKAINFLNEGKFLRKLKGWIITSPKIKKTMRKANFNRLKAAELATQMREKVETEILGKQHVPDISDIIKVLKKQQAPLIDNAEKYEVEADVLAGDNPWLKKIVRIFKLKGTIEVNREKYESAEDEEKWIFDNFEKDAEKVKSTYMSQVEGAMKGKERDAEKTDTHFMSNTIKKMDNFIKTNPDMEHEVELFMRAAVRRRKIERKNLITYQDTGVKPKDPRRSSSPDVKSAKEALDIMAKYNVEIDNAWTLYELSKHFNVNYDAGKQMLDIHLKYKLTDSKEIYDKWKELHSTE